MKRIIAASICVFVASSAMAMLGQPFADVATSQQGDVSVLGGVTLESDVNMYIARASYGIMDGASVFAGLGLFDPDFADSEILLQAGGKYQLPLDLPVDLAIRAAVGIVSGDGWDLMSINGGALASTPINDALTVYGFGGLSFLRAEYGRHSDTETELALAGGAMYAINENISVYGELAMIDEMFISVGLSMKFGGIR